MMSMDGLPKETRFALRELGGQKPYGGYGGGAHLFPFRTEKLSPPALMVLPLPVGE